ncbi:hypothetical protein MTR_7g033295 [Medicago truncatula]|uniref:Uncharacterized protein n=1 Tax=Medicago truncatula TaxID=3880 RepID=A0A072TX84_MEDTR|nr:hypothetical protein MTR_7g033295 [Medicago truncatula]
MKALGWGVEGDAWRWRRRLFVWEVGSVEELRFYFIMFGVHITLLLPRRQVLDIDDQYCAGGCGSTETSTHLFLHYIHFSSVWNHILRWLGVVLALPNDVTRQFTQFHHFGGVTKSRQSILQVIWFATVWEIWKERNNKIFKAKDSPIIQVVDRIKLLTFKWLKVKFPTLIFNYHGLVHLLY